MKLITLIKFVCVVTVLSLAYINMQVKIIELAYNGKAQEESIRRLIDQNGNETYKILTLKSSKNLGVKMLSENSDMNFVDPENVVSVLTSEAVFEDKLFAKKTQRERNKRSLLSLLSFGSLAEARTRE